MFDDSENRPKPPVAHAIGSDLSAVSVEELRERVLLLEAEIQRLRAEERRKLASREAASAVFRA
jgi:uncharacterized small protein (DUF1192 family)